MSDGMDAVIFLSSVTFVVAVGGAIIQGYGWSSVKRQYQTEIDILCSIAFWKKYQVHLHVTAKGQSARQSVDLEGMDLEPPDIQPPQRLRHHSRLGSRNSKRWPGYTVDKRWINRPMTFYDFTSPHIMVEEPENETVINRSSHPPAATTTPATFISPATPAPPWKPEASYAWLRKEGFRSSKP
jgi:hypothetical protein